MISSQTGGSGAPETTDDQPCSGGPSGSSTTSLANGGTPAGATMIPWATRSNYNGCAIERSFAGCELGENCISSADWLDFYFLPDPHHWLKRNGFVDDWPR